jgi:UDP-N-acetylglucosamine 2-epimerase
LVGVDPVRIEEEAARILLSANSARAKPAGNPYGDGLASQRIANAILEWRGQARVFEVPPFPG